MPTTGRDQAVIHPASPKAVEPPQNRKRPSKRDGAIRAHGKKGQATFSLLMYNTEVATPALELSVAALTLATIGSWLFPLLAGRCDS